MTINIYVTNRKMVIDFSSFIVITRFTFIINSISFEATNSRLLLDTVDGCKNMGIESLILKDYPYNCYDTEIIGRLDITRDNIKGYLRCIEKVNWIGIIG